MSGLKLYRNWFWIWASGRSKDKLDVIPMLRVELCYSEIFNHPPTLIINPPRQLYKKHRPSAKDRSHTDRFLCSRWSTVLQFRVCAIVFYLQRTSLSKLCFSICYHVVASQSWSRYRTYESTCRLNILRLIFPQKEPVADTRRCCPVNQTLPRGFIPTPPSPRSKLCKYFCANVIHGLDDKSTFVTFCSVFNASPTRCCLL